MVYKSYAFTETAKQLFSLVQTDPNDQYLLELGKTLKNIYVNDITVNAYQIKSIILGQIDCDTDVDLLV